MVFISLLALVVLYFSGMNTTMKDVVHGSDVDMGIAEHAVRYTVMYESAKWTLPLAILGLLALNVGRFRLRRLAT